MDETYKYADLTHTIIGAAMEVHRYLGNGFQELIYQRALAIELGIRKLNFTREQEMEVLYKNVEVGTRRVDFFIEGKIMAELKAIIQLEEVQPAQALNYLEAYNIETGLLINFGARSLQYKRLFNKNTNRTGIYRD